MHSCVYYIIMYKVWKGVLQEENNSFSQQQVPGGMNNTASTPYHQFQEISPDISGQRIFSPCTLFTALVVRSLYTTIRPCMSRFHREGGHPGIPPTKQKFPHPRILAKTHITHPLMFCYTHCGFNNMMLAVKNHTRMHLRTPISPPSREGGATHATSFPTPT